MLTQTDTHHAETDGQLLPMDALAVRPFCADDLAELVRHVPACLAGELARLSAWRALGFAAPAPVRFTL